MSHLTDTEFVDCLDGRLGADRLQHLNACVECRDRLDGLRTLIDATHVDVPEPSPLFWDHFSARVRDSLDESPAGRWTNLLSPVLVFRAAAVVGALVIGISLWLATSRRHENPQLAERSTIEPAQPARVDAQDDELADEESWAVVRAAAENLEWDDAQAAGMTGRPGMVERAVMALSEREQEELTRLLRDELKRTGAD